MATVFLRYESQQMSTCGSWRGAVACNAGRCALVIIAQYQHDVGALRIARRLEYLQCTVHPSVSTDGDEVLCTAPRRQRNGSERAPRHGARALASGLQLLCLPYDDYDDEGSRRWSHFWATQVTLA
jgi:hypothetical protein